MCLVVLAWQQNPELPLIVAGNRDEFHSRPSQALHWWPDRPDIVAGRDLQAGGTWLGLHQSGRFATVTNFRDADKPSAKFQSRGELVTDFLLGSLTPIDFMRRIDGAKFAGFNLLLSDGETLAWYSNRADMPKILEPGLYGLSNALLDSPWHKVRRSKAALSDLLQRDSVNETTLFRLLADRETAPVDEIESDRLPFATARSVSAPFVLNPDYGTRSSSIVLGDANGNWQIRERRFDASGKAIGDSAFKLGIQP